MNTAVLVIDVQQGLCEGDGAAYDCAGTIARINRVARRARAAGAPVIFIQHESRSGYLEYGSSAWQLASGLEAHSTDLRVRKTTPDSFLGTDLDTDARATSRADPVASSFLRLKGCHAVPGSTIPVASIASPTSCSARFERR